MSPSLSPALARILWQSEMYDIKHIFCISASANDVRDPICHPAAQYIIRENIFGDNKEKQVKKTMNQLLQNHGKFLHY